MLCKYVCIGVFINCTRDGPMNDYILLCVRTTFLEFECRRDRRNRYNLAHHWYSETHLYNGTSSPYLAVRFIGDCIPGKDVLGSHLLSQLDCQRLEVDNLLNASVL